MNYLINLIVIIMLAPPAYAGDDLSKLNALAEKLVAGYQPKNPGRIAIAVPPLNCDAKLTRMRAGFAVSEILSRRFIASEKFTVVERAALDQVFKEQKLAASGAISEDAVPAFGRLTGAGVILLGNVIRINGRYQVNARLVDAVSAEVLNSAYAELTAAAFESETQPYLNLVPEEQALSIFFLYNYRRNANGLKDTTNVVTWGTVNTKPEPFASGLAGGGIRYFPASKKYVEVSLSASGEKPKAGTVTNTSMYSSASWTEDYTIGAVAYRALFGWEAASYHGVRINPALGATVYSFSGGANGSYATPTLQLRAEYRPQARFGISLSACYDLLKIVAVNQDDFSSSNYPSHRARLNSFSFEPAVSLYF